MEIITVLQLIVNFMIDYNCLWISLLFTIDFGLHHCFVINVCLIVIICPLTTVLYHFYSQEPIALAVPRGYVMESGLQISA